MLKESKYLKIYRSKGYNYIFNKKTGFFIRWGEEKPPFSYAVTKEGKDIFVPHDSKNPKDPILAPSAEILDLEISKGKCKGKCSFCYKGNGEDIDTHHMTLDEFKKLLNKFPKFNGSHFLSQIAFGITDIYANPDFFDMMAYARSEGVIPNYTCHGLDLTDEAAQKTSELCGAVAVSMCREKKVAYEAVRKLLNATLDRKIIIRKKKKRKL